MYTNIFSCGQGTIHNYNLGEFTQENVKNWLELIDRGTIPASSEYYQTTRCVKQSVLQDLTIVQFLLKFFFFFFFFFATQSHMTHLHCAHLHIFTLAEGIAECFWRAWLDFVEMLREGDWKPLNPGYDFLKMMEEEEQRKSRLAQAQPATSGFVGENGRSGECSCFFFVLFCFVLFFCTETTAAWLTLFLLIFLCAPQWTTWIRFGTKRQETSCWKSAKKTHNHSKHTHSAETTEYALAPPRTNTWNTQSCNTILEKTLASSMYLYQHSCLFSHKKNLREFHVTESHIPKF